MTSIEFCYWLQGYFELQKTTDFTFDVEQTQTIKNHLNMVFKYDSQPLPFCAFLRGFFNISETTTVSQDQTLIIKEHLSKTFKKYIDSRYSEQEYKDLNQLHTKNKDKPQLPPGIQAMC